MSGSSVRVRFLVTFTPTFAIAICGLWLAVTRSGFWCGVGWTALVAFGIVALLQTLALIDGLARTVRLQRDVDRNLKHLAQRDAELFAQGKIVRRSQSPIQEAKMNLGKWKLFSAYHHVYASEAYNETMRATEQLARDSLLLLDRKPEEERREILAKAENLTERISETLESEAPMVASLGLLTAIRVLERMIKDQAAALRRGTKSRGL